MSFLKKEISRFAFALSGFSRLLKTEAHAKIHLLATFLAVSISLLLKITSHEWLWISLAISLVWIAEAFNTALERLCDYAAGDQRHHLIKDAKDIAAAAVLIASLFALVVATLIWLPF